MERPRARASFLELNRIYNLTPRVTAIEAPLFTPWEDEIIMSHSTVIRPAEHARFSPDKMGKATIFESPRLLVGLNAFEPGQSHALHAHAGQDKVYHVIAGAGMFLLEDRRLPMRAGDLLVAPESVPHGIENTSEDRLVVLAILAPSPPHR